MIGKNRFTVSAIQKILLDRSLRSLKQTLNSRKTIQRVHLFYPVRFEFLSYALAMSL